MSMYEFPKLPPYDSQHPEIAYPVDMPDRPPGETYAERIEAVCDAVMRAEVANVARLRRELLLAASGKGRGANGFQALEDHALKDWHLRHHGNWTMAFLAVKQRCLQ